jgi:hypothetical protein
MARLVKELLSDGWEKEELAEHFGVSVGCVGTWARGDSMGTNSQRAALEALAAPVKHTRESFIRYLRNTLIPDLRESGREFTAEDFETAIAFMEES